MDLPSTCGSGLTENNISPLHDFDYDSLEQQLVLNPPALNENLVNEWQTPATARQPTPVKKKRKRRQDNAIVDKKSTHSYNEGTWRDSVEKYSYRYIPDNGCYRRLKHISYNPTRQAFSQRKPQPFPGVALSHENRTLQRELTRDLRREFNTLMETNRHYFRIEDSEVEQLEDEEDYKSKNRLTQHSSGGHMSDQPPYSSPNSQPSAFVKVQRKVSPIPEMTRTTESQSAQPTGRLEDLIINKRCSSTLDNVTKVHTDHERMSSVHELHSHERAIAKAYDKRKSHPSLQSSFQYVNVEQFELLAQKTFNIRKGETEKLSKQLKPIERVTPSMRELYDNSKAVNEMMKMGFTSQKQQPQTIYPDMKVSAVMPIKQTNEAMNHTFNINSSKKHVNHPLSTKNSGNSVSMASKLGENKSRSIIKRVTVNIEEDANDDFQSFLPSISGKRISSKLVHH